ncbi:MAG: 2-methylcitrate dehydratase, partial [Actinomycetota bacterium]|nr:2-methylcitrate dehydratase [Actinomycetota bacterium]
YVMENVLFKVPYPAEYHAQSALEAAVALHSQVAGRLDEVESVEVSTQRSAMRIISKTGPLNNPADRDHSLEYIVAVGLIKGALSHLDYEDEAAADPRIDALRAKMRVVEDPGFSTDYLDPAKRSVANAVTVRFADGSATGTVSVEYPLGHPRRREEAASAVATKLSANLERLPGVRERVMAAMEDPGRVLSMGVRDFVGLFLP